MTEKDYSLLRPFDLDAAKAGAKLFCINSKNGETECAFIQKAGDELCIHFERYGFSIHDETDSLRMAPLCWVEGKPVYPGDVLEVELVSRGDWCEATVARSGSAHDGERIIAEGVGKEIINAPVSLCRWPRPKPVKRWINIYPANSFESQDSANEYAASSRIACIEIELPPIKP